MTRGTGRDATPESLAAGFLQIAVQNMANAIKRISVARGYDVTQYTLQCFGGAGGQHACAVADALGMTRVFVHPLAGVLSAYGMGLADQIAMREASVELPLDASRPRGGADAVARARRRGARRAARRRAWARSSCAQRMHVRYQGTDTALVVPFGAIDAVRRRVRGGVPPALRVPDARPHAGDRGGVGRGGGARRAFRRRRVPRRAPRRRTGRSRVRRVRMYFDGWHDAGLFVRESLQAGATIDGPAIIAEANATTVVEPGWQAVLAPAGGLELSRVAARASQHAIGTQADPVMLEVFNNLFMNIAEQMGLRLQNTAYSVNIKERLDFSCALFDAWAS